MKILSSLLLILFCSISFAQVDEIVEVEEIMAYKAITKKPQFKACDSNLSNAASQKCFQDSVTKIINSNFDITAAKNLGVTGTQRINTQFVIGADGVVSDIRTRSNNPGLDRLAKKAIAQIPTLIPGEYNGSKVAVTYALPIVFKIAPPAGYNSPASIATPTRTEDN